MSIKKIWVLLGITVQTLSAQTVAPRFLSHPVLTPDAQTVVFSFEGDLWKASVQDGQATRLTAMQGYETAPRISPDGKWLAFTGEQMGNADVYIMPLSGGDVKQLTFHSASDQVANFSWDSKTIFLLQTVMVLLQHIPFLLMGVRLKNCSAIIIF
ncbi:DPP IV N-terminal domain-containing protein [Sediminibacterium sp. C3]|uniref:DPP IV N-terminal domain-containing protein n=1 Tax=Sediminibacterium sp. C3 TaxID=1267211 RepID=UPI00041E1BB3|nr:DPP IV N-terminal domain-containing protein [Sediminibacterium sp. C3]